MGSVSTILILVLIQRIIASPVTYRQANNINTRRTFKRLVADNLPWCCREGKISCCVDRNGKRSFTQMDDNVMEITQFKDHNLQLWIKILEKARDQEKLEKDVHLRRVVLRLIQKMNARHLSKQLVSKIYSTDLNLINLNLIKREMINK